MSTVIIKRGSFGEHTHTPIVCSTKQVVQMESGNKGITLDEVLEDIRSEKADMSILENATGSIIEDGGDPSVTIEVNNGAANFAFKNIKGEKGDDGKDGQQGPQGMQGPQGDSVLVGQGDLPLAHVLGDNNTKAMSQKGVTKSLQEIWPDLDDTERVEPLFEYCGMYGATGGPNQGEPKDATSSYNAYLINIENRDLGGIRGFKPFYSLQSEIYDVSCYSSTPVKNSLSNYLGMATVIKNKEDDYTIVPASGTKFVLVTVKLLENTSTNDDVVVFFDNNDNVLVERDYFASTSIGNNREKGDILKAQSTNYKCYIIDVRKRVLKGIAGFSPFYSTDSNLYDVVCYSSLPVLGQNASFLGFAKVTQNGEDNFSIATIDGTQYVLITYSTVDNTSTNDDVAVFGKMPSCKEKINALDGKIGNFFEGIEGKEMVASGYTGMIVLKSSDQNVEGKYVSRLSTVGFDGTIYEGYFVDVRHCELVGLKGFSPFHSSSGLFCVGCYSDMPEEGTNNNFIGWAEVTENNTNDFSVKQIDGTKYIVITVKVEDNDSTDDDKFVIAEKKYVEILRDLIDEQDESDFLRGKKVAIIGASIVQGYYASSNAKRWTSLFCKMAGATEINLGVASTSLATNTKQSTASVASNRYVTRATAQDIGDADLVIIGDAGVNDFSYDSKAIGNLFDEETITSHDNVGNKRMVPVNDTDTYAGALHELIQTVRENAPLAKIVVMSCGTIRGQWSSSINPQSDHVANVNGDYIFDFYKANRKICEFYGIPYLGLSETCQIDFNDNDINNELSYDGLHPNDKSMTLIANHVYRWMKNNIVL